VGVVWGVVGALVRMQTGTAPKARARRGIAQIALAFGLRQGTAGSGRGGPGMPCRLPAMSVRWSCAKKPAQGGFG
jgi:hypothetical protein